MLNWDAAAVMPPGGGAARGDQLAVLAGMGHEMIVAPEVAHDLAAAEATLPVGDWDRANLALMRHRHTRATAVPTDLVEASERANSTCEKVWREARATNDFRLVSPYLVEVVALARTTASCLAPALDLDLYDALMDGYQRGIGAADVTPIFDRYEAFLSRALPEAEERQMASGSPVSLDGVYPADRQEGLCRMLAARAGLDFTHARLDRSAHPFCGGTRTDIRITTRYDETDPATALLGVLHETGHALYESGLPSGFARQPVGEAAGMAVHESQSLLIEMQACRSDAYLEWLSSELAGTFGGDPAPFAAQNLQRLWRRVERGFIRVNADELTYPAHVILRFRLERAMIAGDLPVADLPSAWNEGLKALLGVVPPDDTRGCLQDIHWYFGAFGYFPSYTLGAMAAAQLMAAIRRVEPGLDACLRTGDLRPLTAWVGEKIHREGSRLGFNALLASATGGSLDPAFFEAHLTSRYLSGD